MRPTDAFPHPADWAVKTVRQAVEIRRGLSWSKGQECSEPKDDNVPVLRIGNIQEKLDLSDVMYISGVSQEAKEKKQAGAGWTILVGSNGNRDRIGNSAYLQESSDFLFGSFLLAAKPRVESGISPEFFYRWLDTAEVQARISASSEGTTGLSNLSHPFLKAMEIAFPPLNEQSEIACILNATDTVIEYTEQAVDKAKRLKQSVTQSFFEEGLGRISSADKPGAYIGEGWRLVRTGQLLACEPKNGISPPAQGQPPGYPTFSIAAVRNGKIDLSGEHLKYVQLPDAIAEKFAVRTGDLLVVRGNANPELVGCCGMIDEHPEMCIYSDILKRIVFRDDEDSVLPRYACIVWNHPLVHNQVLKLAKTSNGTLKINTQDVKRIILPVPTKQKQEDFLVLYDACDKRVSTMQNQISALMRLKRGLMQDLLTGKVCVSIPTKPPKPQLELPLET